VLSDFTIEKRLTNLRIRAKEGKTRCKVEVQKSHSAHVAPAFRGGLKSKDHQVGGEVITMPKEKKKGGGVRVQIKRPESNVVRVTISIKISILSSC